MEYDRMETKIADHTIKILLAEDNPAHQRLLTLLIRANRPYIEVTVASCGKEFQKLVSQQSFDCVLVDYNLPDITADKLLSKNDFHLHGCPALVISSSRDQQIVISSLRNGSVDFIPKLEALEPNVLWNRIELAVKRQRKYNLQQRRISHQHHELARLAETDLLTGLYNRRYFERMLCCGNFTRDRREQSCCVLMDIDHFKNINDNYGHPAGDQVLVTVSRLLKNSVTPADIAIRWGGEEFLMILASTDISRGWCWAETFRNVLSEEITETPKGKLKVTASLGITSFSTRKMDYDIIEQADQAMYLAKKQGRNQTCTWRMNQIFNCLSVSKELEDGNVIDNWQKFLIAAAPLLGINQTEHIRNHSRKVAMTAGKLAQKMSLPQTQTRRIMLAGLLHDLGKAVIPEELLGQVEPLTPQQWEFLSRHSDFGAMLSKKLGADKFTVDCIQTHHKTYDAHTNEKGRFPEVGILAVADALTALTENRPYQPARDFEKALEEIRNNSGTQFDPGIVEAASELAPRPAMSDA